MTALDVRFAEVYEQYYRHIYAFCQRRTSIDKVEDAVAETFLTAWRKIADLPPDGEALPWLYSVAHRAVGHQWRGSSRRARLQQKLNSIGVTSVESAEEFVVVDEESRRALSALSKLNRSDQEVLRLSVWEELSHRAIGQVLGLSTTAVKKRFSRARKRLANELTRMENSHSTSPAVQKGGAW